MLSDEEIRAIAHQYAIRFGYPRGASEDRRKSYATVFYFKTAGAPIDYGIGPFIVSRRDGEVFQLGSGCLLGGYLEGYLEIFAAGFTPGVYKLRLLHSPDINSTAERLVESRALYCHLELECHIVWPRWKLYDKAIAIERLKNLPCNFLIYATELMKLVPRLGADEVVFEYLYLGDALPKYDWHPDRYSSDQLGPQWE